MTHEKKFLKIIGLIGIIVIGCSITNIGCFQLVYQELRPSRAMLALHDLRLLAPRP